MNTSLTFQRPHLDWNAAIWSALISGAVFLLLSMLLSSIYLGEASFPLRVSASLLLGPQVIPASEGFGIGALLLGLLIHFSLAGAFGFLVSLVIYQGGWIFGATVGGLLGLLIYTINYFAIARLFPWLYPLQSWILLIPHIAFGAMAGFTYEMLEQEEPVDKDDWGS